jgi:hypothetical protein
LVADPEELISQSDVYVVGNKWAGFTAMLAQANENKPIVDLVRLDGPFTKRPRYRGINW